MENRQALVKLAVDSIKNPAQVQHYSNGKDADTVIRAAFHKLMGTETPTMKDIRRHKVAIFEIIEEVLDETYLRGIQEDEFFLQFAEVRNVALGDSVEFYVEDDAVLIASEHAGNHWNINRQKLEGGQSFPVKTKSIAIAVYGDFFLFVTGRLSFGKLVEKAAQGIANRINGEVAAAFASATANLPTEFKGSGTYDEEALQEIIAHVEAATGSQPYVVGTRQALAPIIKGLDAQLYSEGMKNTLAGTGRLYNVNGMTLVQLPNVHKANSFDFAYDPKKLLILPSNDVKPIKLVFEGESLVRETTDNTENVDMTFDYKFITKFGVETVFSTLFGTWDLA